jgi:hypothetical protein
MNSSCRVLALKGNEDKVNVILLSTQANSAGPFSFIPSHVGSHGAAPRISSPPTLEALHLQQRSSSQVGGRASEEIIGI